MAEAVLEAVRNRPQHRYPIQHDTMSSSDDPLGTRLVDNGSAHTGTAAAFHDPVQYVGDGKVPQQPGDGNGHQSPAEPYRDQRIAAVGPEQAEQADNQGELAEQGQSCKQSFAVQIKAARRCVIWAGGAEDSDP